MDRKEKKQDPMEDVKKFFRPTQSTLYGIIGAPCTAFFIYMISTTYGPSKKYAPMPGDEKLFLAGLFAIFVIIFAIVIPWGIYFKNLISSKKAWPTEEQQRELNREYKDAVNVFTGSARIGKKYTFLQKGSKIIPTNQIKNFKSEIRGVRSSSTYILVNTDSTNLPVLTLGITKQQRVKADELIKEAEDVLTRMRDSKQ